MTSQSTTTAAPSHAVDKTAVEVALQFGCSDRKVKREAARFGIGINLRGSAGWRFNDADIAALRKALTPPPAVERRRSA